MILKRLLALGVLSLVLPAAAQKTAPATAVCGNCLRAHVEFLAADALQGRASTTQHERIAAEYIAAQLRQYGLQPGAGGEFVQRVAVVRPVLTAKPALVLGSGAATQRLEHVRDIWVTHVSGEPVQGPLRKAKPGTTVGARGAVVLLEGVSDVQSAFVNAVALAEAGAAVVVVPESPALRKFAEGRATEFPRARRRPRDVEVSGFGALNMVIAGAGAAQALAAAAEGTPVSLEIKTGEPERAETWNVVALLPGTHPQRKAEALLLSAHYDGQGVAAQPKPGEDAIFNSADDDASGVAAVLELARLLGSGPANQRTVIFALFGSEEGGGLGSSYFRAHPPMPLKQIVGNLQFEMLGRPDPKVEKLWMTGFDRSTLGPMLRERGARIEADPYPQQDFFRRSDNYALAKMGVVAHGVSSFNLHKDYHQPSDDVAQIDFAHMAEAVGSLVAPVRGLLNSAERPQWVEGKRP